MKACYTIAKVSLCPFLQGTVESTDAVLPETGGYWRPSREGVRGRHSQVKLLSFLNIYSFICLTVYYFVLWEDRDMHNMHVTLRGKVARGSFSPGRDPETKLRLLDLVGSVFTY